MRAPKQRANFEPKVSEYDMVGLTVGPAPHASCLPQCLRLRRLRPITASKSFQQKNKYVGCGATAVPVWTSRKMSNTLWALCCDCWHSFLMESALTGIYVPALDADMRSQDEQMEA